MLIEVPLDERAGFVGGEERGGFMEWELMSVE